MRRLRINIELVKQFSENKELAALSFYFNFKVRFKNSTVFASPKERNKILGQLFHLSRPTVSKHLSVLEKHGLIRQNRKSITAISLKNTNYKIYKSNSVNLYFKKEDSLKDIEYKLKYSLLKKNGIEQLFMINLKQDEQKSNKRINMRHYKKYIRPLHGKAREITKELNISNESLADIMCCSVQQVSYIKNKWQEMGLVRFFSRTKFLGKINRSHFTMNKDLFAKSSFVSKRGCLYQRLASGFELLDSRAC